MSHPEGKPQKEPIALLVEKTRVLELPPPETPEVELLRPRSSLIARFFLNAVGAISTVSKRVRRRNDLVTRIDLGYERIRALVASGGSAEAIAEERRELRRLQHLEAARMTAQAERRSHVAAGEGYAALEAAASLLAKK